MSPVARELCCYVNWLEPLLVKPILCQSVCLELVIGELLLFGHHASHLLVIGQHGMCMCVCMGCVFFFRAGGWLQLFIWMLLSVALWWLDSILSRGWGMGGV